MYRNAGTGTVNAAACFGSVLALIRGQRFFGGILVIFNFAVFWSCRLSYLALDSWCLFAPESLNFGCNSAWMAV